MYALRSCSCTAMWITSPSSRRRNSSPLSTVWTSGRSSSAMRVSGIRSQLGQTFSISGGDWTTGSARRCHRLREAGELCWTAVSPERPTQDGHPPRLSVRFFPFRELTPIRYRISGRKYLGAPRRKSLTYSLLALASSLGSYKAPTGARVRSTLAGRLISPLAGGPVRPVRPAAARSAQQGIRGRIARSRVFPAGSRGRGAAGTRTVA